MPSGRQRCRRCWSMPGPGFPAGNLVVSMAASLAFQDVQVYQSQLISVSQPTPSKYLRFAPGRDTMVRVRLVPNGTSDVYTSQVRLTVSNTALGSQTFVMQGPATLGAASVAESGSGGRSYTLIRCRVLGSGPVSAWMWRPTIRSFRRVSRASPTRRQPTC